jgi:hypothetical protein
MRQNRRPVVGRHAGGRRQDVEDEVEIHVADSAPTTTAPPSSVGRQHDRLVRTAHVHVVDRQCRAARTIASRKITVTRADKPLAITLKKAGYITRAERINVSAASTISLPLTKRPTRPGSGSSEIPDF